VTAVTCGGMDRDPDMNYVSNERSPLSCCGLVRMAWLRR